jgi:signal transduction histidine kinase
LGSILNNAQRYTNTQIYLSAYKEDEYIIFSIEDDGEGYPSQLLSLDYSNNNSSASSISGSTGLGLHFASTIASFHTTKNNVGLIKIDNESCFGGARFRLFLP